MPILKEVPIYVSELFEERYGSPFDVVNNPTGVREYKRNFLVECHSTNLLGPLNACMVNGLPLPFSPYVTDTEADLYAKLVKYEANQISNTDGRCYKVTAHYSSDIAKQDPENFGFPADQNGQQKPGAQNNPEMVVPEIGWDYEEATHFTFDDLNGVPFLNSAWSPFSPPPGLPVHRPILTMSRNETFFSPDTAAEVAGAVNDKPFLGYPIDSVMCMAPKVKLMNDKSTPYWKVDYRLKFGYKYNPIEVQIPDPKNPANPWIWSWIYSYESFQHRELDQGFDERILIGAPEQVALFGGAVGFQQRYVHRPIVGSGTKGHRPTMLDGKGRKQILMKMSKDVDPITGQKQPLYPKPVWLEFQTRRRVDFTNLFKRGLSGQYPPKAKP